MTVRILLGDVRTRLKELPDESVHCCVTSPPYFGLRDYGVDGQIGLEKTPDDYIAELVNVFREVRRVLRKDGTLWLNLGDSYSNAGTRQGDRDGAVSDGANDHRKVGGGYKARVLGYKNKDLLMIPCHVALALQADGWWLRSDIIWHKPNPMPESVTDRPTSAHEHIFLMAKSERYYFDADAVRRPLAESSIDRLAQDVDSQHGSERANGGAKTNGTMKAVSRGTDKQRGHGRRHAGFNDRWDAMPKDEQQANGANIRNVWTIATQPFSEAHFATFPPDLIEPCIKAGCPMTGTVLDPFGGAGTTGLVADRLGRNAILCELNPEYAAIAKRRLESDGGMFATVEVAA